MPDLSTTSQNNPDDKPLLISLAEDEERCMHSVREQCGNWEQWIRRLGRRKKPRSLWKLVPCSTVPPLLWSKSADVSELTLSLIRDQRQLKRKSKSQSVAWNRRAESWLRNHSDAPLSYDSALQHLAWTHSLPTLGNKLDADVWQAVLGVLISTATSARHSLVDLSAERQLFAGELPLSLAYLFPELSVCQQQAPGARQQLSAGILDTLDGEGMPHATLVSLTRELLACWTRCGYMATLVPGAKLRKTARIQFRWLITQVLRLSGNDGQLAFTRSDHDDVHNTHTLLCAAAELTKSPENLDTANTLFSNGKAPHRLSKHLPDPAYHSDCAELGVMRTDWSKKALRLNVVHTDGKVHVELFRGNRTILHGPWSQSILVDGHPVSTTGDWETVCWTSDGDADFLELQSNLCNGSRLQRQFLLARKDRFLLAADTLIAEAPVEITYRLSLPLAGGLTLKQPDETRESYIVGPKLLGTILPLALPEWSVDPRCGSMFSDHAELEQNTNGRALYAPLFLDLDKRRRHKALTWRQLTVAEKLRVVRKDVAVGYRVRISGDQWLFYRSLDKPASRTVLGKNLVSEFYAARFGPEGDTETLVEVGA